MLPLDRVGNMTELMTLLGLLTLPLDSELYKDMLQQTLGSELGLHLTMESLARLAEAEDFEFQVYASMVAQMVTQTLGSQEAMASCLT